MNTRHTNRSSLVTVAVVMIALAGVSRSIAADLQSGNTNKVPASIDPRPFRSVFLIPQSGKEGKDPFFPRSLRPYGTSNTGKGSGTNAATVFEFAIGGVSGTPEKPLVIINNVTFGANDESDVIVKGKRIRLRCLEINLPESRVRIRVGSETRDIRIPARN